LRVLHVTPSFYPAWAYGGIPRCTYELCRSLARLGVEVTVWTTDALDETRRVTTRESVVDGVRVRYFPNASNELAYHRQLYLPRELWTHAGRHIGDFDLVHVHSHRHLLEAIAARAARRAGRPYVFTGHGTVPAIERYVPVKRLIDALGFRSVLTHAAACIAVSGAETVHYRDAGVADERITVIPNGLPLDFFRGPFTRGVFRRTYELGNGPLVVFVGKITPRKGLDVLVRALAQLPAGVRLAVVGNFMMPEEPLRQLVASLGLTDRVRFAGLLVEEEKLAAYVDADVVAYPSVDEIFGLVPAEALMCGAPVVVCDDSGCGEVVSAAGGGLLVRYGDVDGLANAFRTLLGDDALRRRCVASGRRYVEQHLGWDHIAGETRALYARLRQPSP
jgi:glycosyltransferase involved in cell wall biosynthesis